jgi:hypothetical protein
MRAYSLSCPVVGVLFPIPGSPALHELSSAVKTHLCVLPAHPLQVAAQLAEGHNVVLLANHQTEADPGVFAHMLMSTHPNLATDVIYVAGE